MIDAERIVGLANAEILPGNGMEIHFLRVLKGEAEPCSQEEQEWLRIWHSYSQRQALNLSTQIIDNQSEAKLTNPKDCLRKIEELENLVKSLTEENKKLKSRMLSMLDEKHGKALIIEDAPRIENQKPAKIEKKEKNEKPQTKPSNINSNPSPKKNIEEIKYLIQIVECPVCKDNSLNIYSRPTEQWLAQCDKCGCFCRSSNYDSIIEKSHKTIDFINSDWKNIAASQIESIFDLANETTWVTDKARQKSAIEELEKRLNEILDYEYEWVSRLNSCSIEPLAKGCLRAGFSALEWKNGRCGRPFLA